MYTVLYILMYCKQYSTHHCLLLYIQYDQTTGRNTDDLSSVLTVLTITDRASRYEKSRVTP